MTWIWVAGVIACVSGGIGIGICKGDVFLISDAFLTCAVVGCVSVLSERLFANGRKSALEGNLFGRGAFLLEGRLVLQLPENGSHVILADIQVALLALRHQGVRRDVDRIFVGDYLRGIEGTVNFKHVLQLKAELILVHWVLLISDACLTFVVGHVSVFICAVVGNDSVLSERLIANGFSST